MQKDSLAANDKAKSLVSVETLSAPATLLCRTYSVRSAKGVNHGLEYLPFHSEPRTQHGAWL